MGGRSASSGVETFGRKMGTRFTPKQYKDAVSDEADFIFRDLKQNPATQHIIRKSFKGNTATVTFDISGGGFRATRQFVEELDRLEQKYQQRATESRKAKKSTNSWSAYGIQRARLQATQQALDEIQKLKKKIK